MIATFADDTAIMAADEFVTLKLPKISAASTTG